ncbi:signal peptidase I [Kurthia gibsonii]|nr:signal peptidase I [Kurthia sp. 11kri321]MCA9725082.1 signal peptidase I [Kurthia sp.]RXH52024.1 signal peptidase I [Kurthia gibsonii]
MEQEKKKTSKGKEVMSWVWPILIAILIAVGVRYFLFAPVTVKGESMENTYHDNDRVIISKVSKIKRFDVIVFKSPVEDDYYIKRVIGLPGDNIEFKNDELFINGKKYKEDYEQDHVKEYQADGLNFTEDFTMKDVTGDVKVPDNSYFVMGDNRQNSSDSRDYGFIKKSAVSGVVLFKFFPWN